MFDLVRHDALRENNGGTIMGHWRFDIVQFHNRQHPIYVVLAHRPLAGLICLVVEYTSLINVLLTCKLKTSILENCRSCYLYNRVSFQQLLDTFILSIQGFLLWKTWLKFMIINADHQLRHSVYLWAPSFRLPFITHKCK